MSKPLMVELKTANVSDFYIRNQFTKKRYEVVLFGTIDGFTDDRLRQAETAYFYYGNEFTDILTQNNLGNTFSLMQKNVGEINLNTGDKQ